MRGTLHALGLAEIPPHPPREGAATSPRKRGEVLKPHAAPSRIGGWYDSAVSHGK
jgi:hypothetical protein